VFESRIQNPAIRHDSHDAAPLRFVHHFRASLHSERAHDAFEVGVHGILAHREAIGRSLLIAAATNDRENDQLSSSKLPQRSATWSNWDIFCLRAEKRPASHRHANRFCQRARGFAGKIEIPIDAHLAEQFPRLLIPTFRDDEAPGGEAVGSNSREHIKAIDVGQRETDDHEMDCLLAQGEQSVTACSIGGDFGAGNVSPGSPADCVRDKPVPFDNRNPNSLGWWRTAGQMFHRGG
jgi:hypothetical protein